MSSRPVKPTRGRWSRAVKLIISSIYLMAPIALMIYRFWRGQPLDSIILIIVIMLIVASAYTIYGERTVDRATDTAQELTEGDSEDEGKD